MNRYYPYLLKGELKWEQQKRFFHCFHGILDLVVNQKIFTHDSSRDYFTKKEIFKMFHLYFKYDKESSHRFANQLLIVKRLLVGGSIDRLKDKELSALYNLIYVYRDVYFIIHKQIPILTQVFTDRSYTITAEQKNKVLIQIKKSFKLLESAYKKENISYPVQDIYQFGDYLKQAGFLQDERQAERAFSFLHSLMTGIIAPKTKVADRQWKAFFDAFYKTVDIVLYYKTYFTEGLTNLEASYNRLESARLFLSLFPVDREGQKFPLENVDEMLHVLMSFFEEPSDVFLSNLKNKDTIRLFTRTLACFSLKNVPDDSCASEWKKDSSVVKISFPDSQFHFFSDRVQVEAPPSSSKMFLDFKMKELLNNWIHDYKKALAALNQGNVEDTALRHKIDHWLDPFFKWEKDSQVVFGDLSFSNNSWYKAYNLLNYQAFLSLFFSSYFEDSPQGVSFTVWKDMVSQISPLLVMLSGRSKYKSSWKKSFYELFSIGDSFLNSSNRDQLLSFRELIDTAVHLLSAVQKSHQAFDIVSRFCEVDLDSACAAKAIVKEPGVLSTYPRFQSYIFDFKESIYIEKIQKVLGHIDKDAFSSLQLSSLFFFIQIIELNYHMIDRNQSFNLESDELLLFSSQFTDNITMQVPYVLNPEQALSYIMYSFKTGEMPFFTGSDFSAIHYTHWHLSSKISQDFNITPNDFHFLLFDFLHLYNKTL